MRRRQASARHGNGSLAVTGFANLARTSAEQWTIRQPGPRGHGKHADDSPVADFPTDSVRQAVPTKV